MRSNTSTQSSFTQGGYVVIERAISPAEADAYVMALHEFTDRPELMGTHEKGIRSHLAALDELHRFHTTHASAIRLQRAEPLISAVTAILQAEALPLYCTPFERAPYSEVGQHSVGAGAHVHNCEFATSPDNQLILAWIALEDIVPEAGPMWLSPGSHQLLRDLPAAVKQILQREYPELVALARRPRASIEQWAILMEAIAKVCRQQIDSQLDNLLLEKRPVILAKGDAIVFDAALLHGTLKPAIGHAGSRRSCNIRYSACGTHLWNYGHTMGYDRFPPDTLAISMDLVKTTHGPLAGNFSRARYAMLG